MDVKERVEELTKELQEMAEKRAELQQEVANLTLQIAAKEGAIIELSKLLPEEPA